MKFKPIGNQGHVEAFIRVQRYHTNLEAKSETLILFEGEYFGNSQRKSQPRPDIPGVFRELKKKVLFSLTPSSGNIFPLGLFCLRDTYLDLMETKIVRENIISGMRTVASKTTRRYPLDRGRGRFFAVRKNANS